MTKLDYNAITITGLNTTTFFIQDQKYDDYLILKGVDGLGPPDIDVSIARQPNQGAYFQAKVPQNKQIILRVGLNPAWESGSTPADIRELLYGQLTGGYLGDRVAVILSKHSLDGLRTYISEAARIYGYVSKMEIVPFSKDPQVQITIECLSPYFSQDNPVVVTTAGLSTSAPHILNTGQAPTGLYMKLTFSGLSGTIPSWELTSGGGLHRMKFVPPVAFANGHSIEFNSKPGSRFITIHQSTDINGLPYLAEDWMMLYGGDNIFATSDSHFTWNNISFYPQWWGV